MSPIEVKPHRGGPLPGISWWRIDIPLALVLRGRQPVPVLAATFAATLWYWSAAYPRGPVFISLIVALGSCLIAGRRLAAWVALVAGYVAFGWLPLLLGTHPGPSALAA